MSESLNSLEKQIDTISKLLTFGAKIGALLGAACIVSYMLINGHFPQGVSVGDSILFLIAAFFFGFLCLVFSVSMMAVGVLISPAIVIFAKIIYWFKKKFGGEQSEVDFESYRVTLLTFIAAIIGTIIISCMLWKNFNEHWPLAFLPIFQYIAYSSYKNLEKNIKKTMIQIKEEDDKKESVTLKLQSIEQLSKFKHFTVACIIILPLLIGGITSDLVQLAMTLAKIRINDATIYVKPPYATLLPSPVDSSIPEYRKFERATIIFRGVGNTTLIEVATKDKITRLEVPNDSLIIERSKKPTLGTKNPILTTTH